VTSIGDYAFLGCTALTAFTVDPLNIAYSSPDGVLLDKSQGTLILFPGGRSGSYVVPDSVTRIGSNTFKGCTGLTSVTIPNSVTSIGEDAFWGCAGLTSVTIGNSVTNIGERAFSECTALTSVTIPDRVTSIGNGAFFRCTGLTSVSISNGVTSIGNGAFSRCTGLTNVSIPNGVTSIGNGAFSHCTGLMSVTIGNNVTSIGDYAFLGCTGLTAFMVDPLNSAYSSTDGVLLDKNQGTLIQFPGGRSGSYVVPDSVTSIGNSAFSSCPGLTNVTIPNGVTSIGNSAFSSCTGLTSVTIPNGVTSIGSFTFSGCTGLTSVTIPNGVTSIGSYTFSDCTGLRSVVIPNGVISIGSFTFFGCTGLTNVTIPNGVTSIESYTFVGCTGLTSVTIPNSATSIGNGAFSGCTELTSVIIGNSVTHIGEATFFRCTGLTSMTIPNSVTSIGERTFLGCTGLTAFTVDPLNITYSSPDGVLLDKNQRTLIQFPAGRSGGYVVPDSVTRIGNWAFSRCTGLTSVTIPSSVTIIGQSAFLGCTELTAFTVDPLNSAYSSPDGVLFDKSQRTLIQFPGGRKGSYVVPDSTTSIGYFAFSGCTGLTAFTVDPLNSLYSSPDGVLLDKSQRTLVQFPGGRKGSYVVPESVTRIGGNAFSSCTGLTSVIIPSSVNRIEGFAFQDCRGLRSVYFVGNAPVSGISTFEGTANNCTVYYRAGTSGWSTRFDGLPTVLWIPEADIDQDGMTNLQEMTAGSDPADAKSLLGFESTPRLNDLAEEEKAPVAAGQLALYFQSVPGQTYELQAEDVLGGGWKSVTRVSASTGQKRVVLNRPASTGFYRLMVVSAP